jgi:hypothetical protein
MKELLADFGTVEVEREVRGETCKVDIFFIPDRDSLADLNH